jgi:type IV pilus assembly protein PilM
MLAALKKLVTDPPPAYAFELSEAGIAWASTDPFRLDFAPFPQPLLSVSPLKDNVLDERAFAAFLQRNFPASAKRRPCALILPDYCGRVTVLDFDTFPSKPDDQLALVKFRVKKSVPYDIDSAAVSFAVQAQTGKRFEVCAVVIALEIVARYEAAFREAGFHPGYVTTASIAALELVKTPGVVMAARLAGRSLSVSVLDEGALKLSRCVELPEVTRAEMENVLAPTIAYVEDELKKRPETFLTCGFGALAEAPDLGLPMEPLVSRLGAATDRNAGLLGYLEQLGVA